MAADSFKKKSCDQRMLIAELNRKAVPLHERNLTVVAAFDCQKMQAKRSVRRFEVRKELCKLIEERHNPKKQGTLGSFASSLFSFTSATKVVRESVVEQPAAGAVRVEVVSGEGEEARKRFWSHVAMNCSFALAPFGRGLDTHRVWEVLQLGGIPIVLTSSMDRLYSTFPILIVKSWAEVFSSESFLQKKKENIIARFGSPFHKEVKHRLTLDYWVKLIRNDTVHKINA